MHRDDFRVEDQFPSCVPCAVMSAPQPHLSCAEQDQIIIKRYPFRVNFTLRLRGEGTTRMNGRFKGRIGMVETSHPTCTCPFQSCPNGTYADFDKQEYVDPQRVYSEVASTLHSNPLIRPRTNIFGSLFYWVAC